MIFRTAALATFFATTVTAIDELVPPGLCYDWSDYAVELGRTSCNPRNIKKTTKALFKAMQKANPVKCKGGPQHDLMVMTGTTDLDSAHLVIEELCKEALHAAAEENGNTDWSIDGVNDLSEYYAGGTFLNLQTGNFQQTVDQFNKRGGAPGKFINVSTDPRTNDHYPTSEESYAAGESVRELMEGDASKKYLTAPAGFTDGCVANTAMCCWHRDRQYFDKNGNCNHMDCANQNPGDNSDLCWTEHEGDVFPYPSDTIEKDIHCHGVSWGNDDANNYSIHNEAIWNAFYYVSLFDHMYTRGYVESLTNDPKIMGSHPMCGCIEDMPVVARADCQQAEGKAKYTAAVVNGLLEINHVAGSFKLEFNSCEGYRYVDPDDLPIDETSTAEFKDNDNDLAGFVYRQHHEGKLTNEQVAIVEQTLIGYRDPTVNDGDNERDAACKRAFTERFGSTETFELKEPIRESEVDV